MKQPLQSSLTGSSDMLKKLLAPVGIGVAQVDTQLDQELLTPGQFFRADVVVIGGEVA
jgi:sporulation-control protein spo0M